MISQQQTCAQTKGETRVFGNSDRHSRYSPIFGYCELVKNQIALSEKRCQMFCDKRGTHKRCQMFWCDQTAKWFSAMILYTRIQLDLKNCESNEMLLTWYGRLFYKCLLWHFIMLCTQIIKMCLQLGKAALLIFYNANVP